MTLASVGLAEGDGIRQSDQSPALRNTAQAFEAMVIAQLLQPMFDTVDSAHSLFGGGAAEAAISPMLTEALAKNLAAHGGLGLAKPVFDSLLRAQEAGGWSK
jgi:Rod binding domain-containing protein